MIAFSSANNFLPVIFSCWTPYLIFHPSNHPELAAKFLYSSIHFCKYFSFSWIVISDNRSQIFLHCVKNRFIKISYSDCHNTLLLKFFFIFNTIWYLRNTDTKICSNTVQISLLLTLLIASSYYNVFLFMQNIDKMSSYCLCNSFYCLCFNGMGNDIKLGIKYSCCYWKKMNVNILTAFCKCNAVLIFITI